jgi:subtilisin family serine protease
MLTTDRARSVTFLAFLFVAGLSARTVSAQSRGSPPPRIPAQALVEARTRGTTRVIVGLNVGFTPEALLAAAEVATQRASIATAQSAVLQRMQRVNPSSIRRFTYIPFLALDVDEGDLTTLAASPDVNGIEIDAVVPAALAASTPLIGATRAWAAGYTGAGWTVAVLDTGVDSTHPFLTGKVISEACYSSTIAGRSNSSCPGGMASSTGAGSGAPCSLAACNHGTHVAGIAAGKGFSFSGVARDASLIAIQVFSSFLTSTDCGSRATPCALSFFSDQILGLERVYALRSTYNIAAVNISIGGGGSTVPCDATLPSMKSIIDQLRAVNIATVIASGNDGFADKLAAPACISTAISVASTADGTPGSLPADIVSSFSNTNQYLSLFAPGETILSSVPGGGFANFVGTSMAAPHVAGAWALIKSKSPAAPVTQVLDALTATGTAIVDPRNGITKPRINIDFALRRHADLIWQNLGDGGLAMWPLDGSYVLNTVSLSISRVNDTNWRIVGSGDLNGDGRADLVWRHQTEGWLAVWYLAANQVLDTQFLSINRVADRNWQIKGVDDIDGDGKADLIWQHQTDGWLAAWMMDGSQVRDTRLLSIPRITDGQWQIAGAGDTNGDGYADLVWQHQTQGWLAVWYMRGENVMGTELLSVNRITELNWHIRGVGDVDGDNHADVIWQNDATGGLGVWLLNGSTVVNQRTLSIDRVSDLNWRIVGPG